MKDGIKKFYILSICLVIILISGYFVLLKKSNFSKTGKIEYVKESSKQTNSAEENLFAGQEKKEEIIIQKDDNENIKKADIIKNETIEKLPSQDVKPSSTKNESNKGKSDSSEAGKIVDKLMSSGFEKSSGRKIDTIIVHTSYNAIGSDPYDIDDIIKQYRQYEVSAHYLIGRDGVIYRLVKDENIAWHAGVSKMPDGRTNINDFSIGIEVVNTKEGKFSDVEYEALNKLIKELKDKYPIKNILGHEDIAPGRKTDPWGIEWDKVDK